MISKQSKRRKIAGDTLPQGIACPIYNLFPEGILKEVAKFLEAPSRVLLAIAIEPPSSPYDIILARCQPKLTRSPITCNNDWHTLDFGDIEKELAAMLTDDDISKVLLHVDAAHKVKRLRLTNCTGITGACLTSLQHSASIEQIDMSLVEAHKNPRLEPTPLLTCDQVLPILRSIISQERNSLKHLQFPHVWRHAEIADYDFVEFLNEYNRMMENREATFCQKCNHNIDMSYCMDMDTCEGDERFAVQEDTCGVCTNYYCSSCKADDDHFAGARLCLTCQRRYCSKCSTMVECGNCDEMYCVGCTYQTQCASPECLRTFCHECRSQNSCQHCGKSWCNACSVGLDLRCFMCGEICCSECSEKEGTNGVHSCDECRESSVYSSHSLCDKCRVGKCKSYDDCNECCKSCVKIVSALILKENKQLHDETKSLKEEMKSLKDENKKMRGKISMARIFLRD